MLAKGLSAQVLRLLRENPLSMMPVDCGQLGFKRQNVGPKLLWLSWAAPGKMRCVFNVKPKPALDSKPQPEIFRRASPHPCSSAASAATHPQSFPEPPSAPKTAGRTACSAASTLSSPRAASGVEPAAGMQMPGGVRQAQWCPEPPAPES